MKEKISITIDVTKISKSKIIARSFKNKAGATITVKELKLDIVPLKEAKILKDTGTYTLYKTHFVSEQQTKEEREAKTNSHIIGEGMMFVNKEAEEASESGEPAEEAVDDNDIPF